MQLMSDELDHPWGCKLIWVWDWHLWWSSQASEERQEKKENPVRLCRLAQHVACILWFWHRFQTQRMFWQNKKPHVSKMSDTRDVEEREKTKGKKRKELKSLITVENTKQNANSKKRVLWKKMALDLLSLSLTSVTCCPSLFWKCSLLRLLVPLDWTQQHLKWPDLVNWLVSMELLAGQRKSTHLFPKRLSLHHNISSFHIGDLSNHGELEDPEWRMLLQLPAPHPNHDWTSYKLKMFPLCWTEHVPENGIPFRSYCNCFKTSLFLASAHFCH